MKNISNKILFGLLAVSTVLSFSCKDDDQLDSIIIKRSADLSIAILDGDEPVVDQKVYLYSQFTSNALNILHTDEKGMIHFGTLNEGVYSIEFEIKGYVNIDKEVQVISGGATNKTIQIKDYVGTYTVQLYDDNTNEIIKEDHGYGIAIIPYTKELDDAKEEDLLSYAKEIKYFDAEGIVTFELPTYYYVAFLVKKDDESLLDYVDDIYIDRLDERKSRAYVDLE